MNTATKLTTQRVSRINSLLNKMLTNAERSESSSSRTESIDRKPEPVQQRPSVNPNLKRNLFGVTLNSDQLKQDLNTMYKEQIEIQKVKWNFDFENLKPVESNTDKFKWTRINLTENTNNKYISTLLNDNDNILVDKENLNSLKTNDIPQFYKQQRSLKLIDNNTPVLKVQETEIVKPKPVKNTKNSKLHGLNQIITFSENRKDTLRSASASTKVVKSTSSAFSSKTLVKKTDNMKQTSLLDMLKQRKKKIQTTTTNTGKPSPNSKNTNEVKSQLNKA
ncbi:unnamed protein product [Brachionus calyciflorus]|uniref:Cyclin-dependent kinase inhibitor domain-containing protein n=1 Tax=Brachionus calyciflorus TaxID=104777 RepID=A0A814DTC9_9BILA|nr:unnamed protein product [Brachionus calyciflorus]